MSKKLKKLKKKEFHFNLNVLFRWAVFALIIYISIQLLSGNKSSIDTQISPNLKVLGIDHQPVIIKATEIFNDYKNQFTQYLDNQVNDLKKQIVTKVYEEVIKSIDSSHQ